jgi:hypothetical protein
LAALSVISINVGEDGEGIKFSVLARRLLIHVALMSCIFEEGEEQTLLYYVFVLASRDGDEQQNS